MKRELLQAWKQAERGFKKQQKEWDAYCNEDRPAYEKWLHATFGNKMTELRELHDQLRRKSWFIEQVEHLSYMSGKSSRKLYQELHKKTEKGISLEEALNEYIAEYNTTYEDEEEEEIFFDDECDSTNDVFDNIKNIFSQLFGENIDDSTGDAEEDFNGIFDDLNEIAGGGKKVDPETLNFKTRIKDIYRKLCFKLHPDTGCDFNAENSRLWHQIQEAYQNNDLDRLQAIQASLDMKQNPMAPHISCTQILAVINDFKNGVRSVRSLVRKAKQESSWRFLSWSDKQRKVAVRQLEQQFTCDQLRLKYELDNLERIEQQWGKTVVAKNKPKPKPKPQAAPKPKAPPKPKTKAKTTAKVEVPPEEPDVSQMFFDF
ncbi:MAG: J domain-containing protein [Victivallaceae bacterium]